MSNLVEQATQYMSIGTVIEEAVDDKKILKDLEDMFKERKAYKRSLVVWESVTGKTSQEYFKQ